jgi:hypothetical protein
MPRPAPASEESPSVHSRLHRDVDVPCRQRKQPSAWRVAWNTSLARLAAMRWHPPMPLRAYPVALSIGLLGLAIGPVASQSGHHGQGHAENHDWYQQLKQPGTGYSCCTGTVNGIEGDCRPTRAYQTDDGTWRALINGRWVPVPPRVVLQQLAPDGNSHICASRSGMIYCFLGGSPES